MALKGSLIGKTLIIAANSYPPYTSLESLYEMTKFNGGIEGELMNSLKDYFKFEYHVIDCNGTWGSYTNGTWTGVIGKVVYQQADIGIGGLSLTSDRYEVVQFSKIYLFSPATYITPPPGFQNPVTLIVESFDVSIWFCIIIALFAVIIAQRIIFCKIIKDEKSDITWALIAALFKQVKPKYFPTSTAIRLIYLFWSFACVVIGVSYGGSLFSMMTLPKGNPAIDTVEKLVKEQSKGNIQIIDLPDSSYYQTFKSANSGVYKEIGKFIKPIANEEEGYRMVGLKRAKKRYSFISSRDGLRYRILLSEPNTYYLPPRSEDSSFFSDTMAMAFNKHFSHLKQFNFFITNMICNGFFDFWRKKVFRQVKLSSRALNGILYEEKSNESNVFKPLNLEQLQSAFYLFIIGILISIILFAIEMMFSKKKTTKSVSNHGSVEFRLEVTSDEDLRYALYVKSYYFASLNRSNHQ